MFGVANVMLLASIEFAYIGEIVNKWTILILLTSLQV